MKGAFLESQQSGNELPIDLLLLGGFHPFRTLQLFEEPRPGNPVPKSQWHSILDANRVHFASGLV